MGVSWKVRVFASELCDTADDTVKIKQARQCCSVLSSSNFLRDEGLDLPSVYNNNGQKRAASL